MIRGAAPLKISLPFTSGYLSSSKQPIMNTKKPPSTLTIGNDAALYASRAVANDSFLMVEMFEENFFDHELDNTNNKKKIF